MAFVVLFIKMHPVKAVTNASQNAYKCYKIYPTNTLPVTLLQLLASNVTCTES